MLIFEEWRKPENPEENLSEQSKEPTHGDESQIKPGPRRWEVSAITTRPSLLSVNIYDSYPSSKLFEIPPAISSKVF